jgi:hypothetical protein
MGFQMDEAKIYRFRGGKLFFGARLQLAREFRGLTQTLLGERVAASCALISLCETGKKKDPAPDQTEACSSVLGFAPGSFTARLEMCSAKKNVISDIAYVTNGAHPSGTPPDCSDMSAAGDPIFRILMRRVVRT